MNSMTPNVAPRRVSSAWGPFAAKLASVLEQLREDQFLIISTKRSNRYVQFAGQGAFGLRAETVCNQYLPASDQLDEAQIATLQGFGWHLPTGSPDKATPEHDPDGSPNFYIDYPLPVPYADLADLATRTLVEVLRVPHPGFLQYSSFDSGENTLVWPDLGLKRATKDEGISDIAHSLLATIRGETGIADLEFDTDGDIGIRYGSVLAWLCLTGRPPHVRILTPLLREVEETPRLLSRLNELNASIGHPLFYASSDSVVAVTYVPAAPYVADHVAQALRDFCQLTDGIDELLQSEFGGRTTFEEVMPSALKH